MNDFSQPQNDNQTNDGSTQNTQGNDQPNNDFPAFKIDLSGYKDKAPASGPTIVGSSPETGPIILDNRIGQTKEQDKKIEFGNEAIQNIEMGREELKSEKSENAAENSSSNTINSSPVQAQVGDITQEEKEPPKTIEAPKQEALKYSGYPIDEALVNDVERVKREKGKGEADDGFSAVLLFLDRLFRIRDRAK